MKITNPQLPRISQQLKEKVYKMTQNNLPEKFSNFVIFKTADGGLDEQRVCRKFRHTTLSKDRSTHV